VVLLFSMNRYTFGRLNGSVLYRALTAFSLLAAIPLLVFGTVVFYEHLNPLGVEGRQLLVFILMLTTLVSALIFGMGMTIRLVRPILHLKESVDRISDEGFSQGIAIDNNDEIGELAQAFNEMVVRLGNAIEEQERYCRLAATGELAATLAHELKNPLNAIGGAASYIGKNYKGQIIEEFTKVISDEVLRINKLATNLLCFAKPLIYEAGQNDINKVVRETVCLLSKEALEQQIRLTAELGEDLPLIICDYNQIKQVLINLIINAFDAIDGKGDVTVSTSSSRDKIAIVVKDSGSGIKPNDLKHIFNPFFTTKTRGTGLGLAISKRIAYEHGGDLTVESTYGAGSEFTILLPRRSPKHGL
jgi:signal transduction histidine kinase